MALSHGKILIADDDEYVLLSLKLLLEQHYRHVTVTRTPQQIPSLLEREHFDAVLLDMNFRHGDTASTEGLYWLRNIRGLQKDAQVILITAYGEIELAVTAMKEGANDFVMKPWENEKLLSTVSNAVALSMEKKKVNQLTSRQKTISSVIDSQFPEIIGNSDAIHEVMNQVSKVSDTDAEVLILGENGTGKEVLARSIHRRSKRAGEVFISIDLGSISESIFESELFGHKKGAFTDAKEERVGRIEAAQGGTIFFDEIGNLSLPLQSKLLTFLQSRKITRVGTNDPIDVNVRVLCATNYNLDQQVKEGKFREDLLYRINTVTIKLPALRDRPRDIPVLAKHFLDLYSRKYQKKLKPSDVEAIEILQQYAWPGNIRELQHAIERAVIMNDSGELRNEDFRFLNMAKDDLRAFDDYNLEKVEAWAIRKAIKKYNGNISHAAQELGLSRGALYRRIQRYGI